ncbi:MAG: restriction endonuclease subunit S, partial [Alphaproteobacteria bacterium]
MSSKTKTPATKEDGKPALVPKLRFPGFNAPWAHEPLSRVLKEHKIKNTDGRDVFSVSMEYGIVNQIELLGRSFAAADTSHYTIGRRYDVVYTKSPLKAFPFGIVKQCKFDAEVALSPLYGVFTPPNRHLGLMIEAYFESPNRSKVFLSPLCQKGAKNTLQITNTTFLSGRMPLPTQPAEQQKIAECLSSVDELMAAQSRKLDALKTHKKGLMQQLFPREGETQPRLRFPEFLNAGEWETKRVDARGGVLAGKALAVNASGPLRPYLRTKNVLDGAIDVSDVLTMPMTDAEFSRFEVVEGDILLNEGQSLELVGRTSTYRGEFGRRCAMQNALLRFRAFPSTCPEFAAQAFRQCQKDGTFASISTQTTSIAHLGSSRFSALALNWPPSLPEQQRIAACLTSLDDLIAVQTQKIEALKTHK